jgi:hypothetical protein
MENVVPFVAKISKIKTRAKKNKDYYVFRINIPKAAATKLSLAKDDFIFFRAMKAQWYHMLKWKEMRSTWEMLPKSVKSAIRNSEVEVPAEPYTPFRITTMWPPNIDKMQEQTVLVGLMHSGNNPYGANS